MSTDFDPVISKIKRNYCECILIHFKYDKLFQLFGDLCNGKF